MLARVIWLAVCLASTLAPDPARAQQVVTMPGPVAAAPGLPQVINMPELPASGPVSANIERWAPLIRDAAERFGIPESWIREVMRMESGGNQGAQSWAGAMGLMQVIPSTYALMRFQHGLGADPYEPRNNIMAGAAYIREMYDLYGYPAFLAAYNAGPRRVDGFMAGQALPLETVNYLNVVAPRLSGTAPAEGPLAAFSRKVGPAGGPDVVNVATSLATGGAIGGQALRLTPSGVRVMEPARGASGLIPRGMLGGPQLVTMPAGPGNQAVVVPLPPEMVAQLLRSGRR